MSTVALNDLLTYILSLGLSSKNKRWLADRLIETDQDTICLQQEKMKRYCESHFDESFVSEMEEKNYLIGSAQPTNEDEFRDIDEMFKVAEASGECSELEVAKMFAL